MLVATMNVFSPALISLALSQPFNALAGKHGLGITEIRRPTGSAHDRVGAPNDARIDTGHDEGRCPGTDYRSSYAAFSLIFSIASESVQSSGFNAHTGCRALCVMTNRFSLRR